MSIDRVTVKQIERAPVVRIRLQNAAPIAVPECQMSSLLLQAGPPSAGGCAAASAAGRDLRSRCRTDAFSARLASDQCLPSAPPSASVSIPSIRVLPFSIMPDADERAEAQRA